MTIADKSQPSLADDLWLDLWAYLLVQIII